MATANVLTGNGHENAVYELSGKLNANLMKGAGVPEAYLPMLVNTQKGIRDGGLEIESDDLEILLGRPATPINEALSKIVGRISQTGD